MRFFLDVVRGSDPPGRLTCEAATVDEAITMAQGQGFHVLAARGAGIRSLSSVSWRSQSTIDPTVLIEQLRELLLAGMSVIEALETLLRSTKDGNHRGKAVLSRLIQALRAGHSLSEALAKEPAFPNLLVALVRAAELTSDLPAALARYLEHQARADELRHRILAVAIYPAVLCSVGVGVLAFLLFYVMPRFARVFDGMHGELPWSARAMVSWAEFLGSHQPGIVAGALALLVGLVAFALSPDLRGQVLKRASGLKAIRHPLRIYFLARWYRATGMLVAGGIPLPEALRLSMQVLPRNLQGAGLAVEAALREGLSPAVAHLRAGMSTPVAEQLLVAGERTGDMGAVLGRIAAFHEAEVARGLERAMRLLEPLVMVFIGVGVGGVVVLMYMPIFELASAIQ